METLEDNRPMRQADHDLLVTIHTKLERVIADVSDLNKNVMGRIEALENGKSSNKEMEELRTDIRWLQRIAFGGLGILAAVQFYFSVIRK